MSEEKPILVERDKARDATELNRKKDLQMEKEGRKLTKEEWQQQHRRSKREEAIYKEKMDNEVQNLRKEIEDLKKIIKKLGVK